MAMPYNEQSRLRHSGIHIWSLAFSEDYTRTKLKTLVVMPFAMCLGLKSTPPDDHSSATMMNTIATINLRAVAARLSATINAAQETFGSFESPRAGPASCPAAGAERSGSRGCGRRGGTVCEGAGCSVHPEYLEHVRI